MLMLPTPPPPPVMASLMSIYHSDIIDSIESACMNAERERSGAILGVYK